MDEQGERSRISQPKQRSVPCSHRRLTGSKFPCAAISARVQESKSSFDITLSARVGGLYPSGRERGADQVDVLPLYHPPTEERHRGLSWNLFAPTSYISFDGPCRQAIYITGRLTRYTVANNGFTQFRETRKLQTMHRRRCCKVCQRWRAPLWGLLPALRRWSLSGGSGD